MPEKQCRQTDPFYLPALFPLGSQLFATTAEFRRGDLTDRDGIVGSEIPKFSTNEILDKAVQNSHSPPRLTYFYRFSAIFAVLFSISFSFGLKGRPTLAPDGEKFQRLKSQIALAHERHGKR